MSDDKKIKGRWWLPDTPGKQLLGEITYGHTSGAQLSLFDHFEKDSTAPPFCIWGKTIEGSLITLFNCQTTNVTSHYLGGAVSEISSFFGVVGGHVQSADELKFAKVSANLSHLHTWAARTGIKMLPRDSGKGWQVTQDMVPNVSLGNEGEFRLALEFRGHLSPAYADWRLFETCAFTVESERPVAYQRFEEIIHHFEHFVALGISRPVYALSINARGHEPLEVVHNEPKFQKFEMIREVSLSEDINKPLRPFQMQFSLEDLQPTPANFIQQFLAKTTLLEPVCDLYFSTLYNPKMYVEQRFLALAHAVEAYHRSFIGGKYQSDREYRNGLQNILWDVIPQNLDADFRASLKNKLKYLHEFSLRKRVQDICGRFAAVLKPFVGEISQFAGAIADLRNWLIHPDSGADDRSKKLDLTEIWLASEQLALVIEVCLLHEIGFSEQAVARLVPHSRRTRAIELNKK